MIPNRLDELTMLVKKYEVDLWISHMPFGDFSPAVQFLLMKLLGVKTILQLHLSIKESFFRFPIILQYQLADAVIVLSNMRRQFLQNFGIHSYYIQNPITIKNPGSFRGRNPRKSSNTVIWIGRIDISKNPFAVVPIIKEVAEKIPTVKLKIIGTADNSDTLQIFQQLITANHVEQNIEFCGYHMDVAPFYEEADVILFTSPREGASLVVAESKFFELPLVLYDLPDHELTRNGKGCITVTPGDSHAAAQAIIKILTDESFRCNLSAQARESIQPFMDYDIAGAWQRVFDDLDNDATPPTRNTNNEQIQTMLLEEIFQLTQQVNALNAQIANMNKT